MFPALHQSMTVIGRHILGSDIEHHRPSCFLFPPREATGSLPTIDIPESTVGILTVPF